LSALESTVRSRRFIEIQPAGLRVCEDYTQVSSQLCSARTAPQRCYPFLPCEDFYGLVLCLNVLQYRERSLGQLAFLPQGATFVVCEHHHSVLASNEQ
jgi:hypothetical protein